MSRPLQIAVVGHTNTGKTSLLRTLTRNARFGDVLDGPGTTRHVEGARMSIDGQAVLEWFDTPGLEDSVALLDYLDVLSAGERLDGPARIARFLKTPEAKGRFEQEARVLTKVLDADAALYVIDTRDPVLPKYRDELALLALCGRPILPVLNFIQTPGHSALAWREAMARLGLHVQVEFDTVLPPMDGPTPLYDRLALLLDAHAAPLQALAADARTQRQSRATAACTLLAELVVDVAAFHLACAPEADAVAQATQTLRNVVRKREQRFVDAALALYDFDHQAYAAHPLPLAGERWGMDLFHPQVVKDFGVRVGASMAAGAAAGAAVDIFTAGLSLGTGTLVGAAAGGMWQGVEQFGKRLAGRLRGHREISVDDGVLRVLVLRGQSLIKALERRGHAATQPFSLDDSEDEANAVWRSGNLPTEIKEIRSRPQWSAMDGRFEDDERRVRLVAQLARMLTGNGTFAAPPPGRSDTPGAY